MDTPLTTELGASLASWLTSPPLALLVYLLLATLLMLGGRLLAGPSHPSALKASTYASGEAPPSRTAVTGYSPFFLTAMFFVILHLGVLIVATGGLTPLVGVYLVGLGVASAIVLLG
jgi:NADH:ubiquinone oxidoreductase subunit 3 (subunit A)